MLVNLKNLSKFKRSKQILSVLVKYGLEYFIYHSKVSKLIRIPKKTSYQNLTLPERLRLALEELGPTFIKFGQILSTRPDFLPPAFINELEKLQDQIPPFSNFQEIVKQELGQPINKLFKHFELKPVAAASLSQVHRAVLPNGEVVAVKIQRPNIKQIIELDLEILEDLTSFLKTHLHNHWPYRPKLIIEEFKRAIKKELDFVNEAYNYEKFRMNFKDINYFKVPKVYWNMVSSKILTMEFIQGTKIDEITRPEYKNIFEPKKVAKRGAKIILKQIFEDRFFHSDPHPANLLILPPATIAMIDVGQVGYLDQKTIDKGIKLLNAIINQDEEQCVFYLESLGIATKEVNHKLLEQDLREFLNRYSGIPLGKLKIRNIGQNLLEIMVKHNLVLPANLALITKALSMAETIGQQIDPDFDMISTLKPFIKRLLVKRFAPQELLKKGKNFLQRNLELVEQLPQDLINITEKLKLGKLKFTFEHKGLEELIKEINRSSNQISFSLVIAALIVGSSLILQQQIGPLIFGYPIFGIAGYILASILGLGLIISILKSRNW